MTLKRHKLICGRYVFIINRVRCEFCSKYHIDGLKMHLTEIKCKAFKEWIFKLDRKPLEIMYFTICKAHFRIRGYRLG